MPDTAAPSFQIDRKKRQVTLYDPSAFRGPNQDVAAIGMEERKIGVAAPKMFAFDGLFTADDSQVGSKADFVFGSNCPLHVQG